ncbi:cell division control protein 48 [Senna tora]|uniref:Cell division control protein 48 n=1 Tax=Senna tora TaxID=362788 RepID=A0A834SVV1_9FABA|nr:cell division control protein 48 [Senna tora]
MHDVDVGLITCSASSMQSHAPTDSECRSRAAILPKNFSLIPDFPLLRSCPSYNGDSGAVSTVISGMAFNFLFQNPNFFTRLFAYSPPFPLHSRALPDAAGPCSSFPAVLVGIFGAGVLNSAYADANESASEPSYPSTSPSSSEGVEGTVKTGPLSPPEGLDETAKKERERILHLLRSRGIPYGSYPNFNVAVKGQKVSIKFQIPPTCEVTQLLTNLVSQLGVKVEENGGGSDMILRAWDSTVAWQLILSPPKQKDVQGKVQSSIHVNPSDEDLCVLIYYPIISSDKAEIEFIKKGSLSLKELDAFVSVLQLAGTKLGQRRTPVRRPREEAEKAPSVEKSIASLESMGVRVYGLNEPHSSILSGEISWDNIAGYENQKREIENTILLALQSPEVYDDIARGTRHKYETNRPRAVLFEGPPGTGKTSCARVIANQAGVPLLYVPLEVVMSKYYGESENLLGKVFSLANELPKGALIFLDEVDSFAAARDNEMHEATRRILSVLLRQIDGFEQDKRVIVVAATNRKQDLDPALISRFDTMITFGLPDHHNRKEIAAKYAKHLKDSELDQIARVTEGMSGRDIRDVCLQAERSWASKIIRGQVSKEGEEACLPPLQEYVDSGSNRQKALLSIAENRTLRRPTTGNGRSLA